MKKEGKGFTLTAILVTFSLMLVAAAVSGIIIYNWQHNQVKSLEDKVSTLNSEVAKLTATAQSSCPTSQSTNTGSCSNNIFKSPKGVSATIFVPAKNASVSSPIAVMGEVPGNWSFEAQLPALLKDSQGNTIAQATAQLLGSWQTEQLVPFSLQFTYSSTQSGSGSIVLQKDNPSGLSSNADSISIPINFK